ncbi:hypothetical protein LY78DRAFT_657216 [Colletotrichum sublineola]|nr:hypothetical protein LY78DRAFT_657216 [Colletotrichum sublineola]
MPAPRFGGYGEDLSPRNRDVIEWLLYRKASVNLEDRCWIVPLHVVSRYGVHRQSTVKLPLPT